MTISKLMTLVLLVSAAALSCAPGLDQEPAKHPSEQRPGQSQSSDQPSQQQQQPAPQMFWPPRLSAQQFAGQPTFGFDYPVRGPTIVAQPAAVAPALGTAGSFAVLGASTVTNTGPTIITGKLGLSPGSAVTGFPPGQVIGSVEIANGAALQAQTDTTTAYNALAGEACDLVLTGQDLGGLTLTPGTYCFSSSAQLTGALTLDAQGDPAAVFVFQIASSLTTASNALVLVTNGGNPCNVYWQVGSSATLGTGTAFKGSILALASITVTTGATISGRALARTGAITLDSSNVSASACSVAAVVDAGFPDAGTGGAVDAGVVEVDAGVVVVDGGSGGPSCEDACFETDHDNCGFCGNVCGATESCVAGACVCN